MKKLVFTDRWLRSLKPAAPGTRDEYADTVAPSLRLRVTDTGSTTFSVFRRIGQDERPVRRTIGNAWKSPLPSDVELPNRLADIRSIARQAVADMSSGIDPKQKADEAKRSEQRRRADTFAVTFDAYTAAHLSTLRTGVAVAAAVRNHVFPAWGERSIADIRRADWKELVRSTSLKTGANRLLAYLKHFFDWAVDEEIIEDSPLKSVKKPSKENKRDRTLAEPEIRAIWRASGQLGAFGAAFRFMLATGQRRTECGSMTWGELDEKAASWSLAPERTKAGRGHELPLSSLALSIIAAQPKTPGNRFVFSTRPGAALSGWGKAKDKLDILALAEIRKELGDEAEFPNWRLHDLRRSCATGLAKLGIDRVVIAKILNHAEREVTAVYDRHRYEVERRAALQKWADKLAFIVEPPEANVLHLHRAEVSRA